MMFRTPTAGAESWLRRVPHGDGKTPRFGFHLAGGPAMLAGGKNSPSSPRYHPQKETEV